MTDVSLTVDYESGPMPSARSRTLRTRAAILVVLPALLVAPGLGWAQAPSAPAADLRDLSLDDLAGVRVTSVSKAPTDLWGTAAAIHVITRADIRRSGATSLPEVLRLAPGVEVARVDSSHWSIGIRGFGEAFSKSILVLIDGRNIYSPLFAGTYWPAYDTPLEDVERIEIIRGPGGTIWGGNAVNGVINILTRRASDSQGTLMSIGTGTSDRGTALVRHGGQWSQSLSYRVYAKGFGRAPQYHDDRAAFDGNWWMATTGFRLDHGDAGPGAFTLQGEISRGRHGQRVQVSSFSPVSIRPLDGLVDTAGGYLRARWEPRVSSHAVLIQAYYDRLDWEAPHFAETRNTVDVDYLQRAPLWLRQQLAWGAGARWSRGVFREVLTTVRFDPAGQTDHTYSGFLQDEVHVIPGLLTVTGGAKVEHNSYTGLEVMPGIRALWTPHPSHTVWGAATRAVRTPSRIERAIRLTSLASPAGPIFLQVAGDAGFDAEQVVSYESGYRTFIHPRVSTDVTAFYSEHDDLASFGLGSVGIETTPRVHGLIRLPFVNGIAGTSRGLEVAGDGRLAGWWRLSGSYAFRHVSLYQTAGSVDPNAVGRYEGSSPQHLGRVQSAWTLPHGLELDASVRAVGALPAKVVARYATADARVAWRFADTLELSVTGSNLLQPHHLEFGHDPGPSVGIRRSVYGSLTWSPRPTP